MSRFALLLLLLLCLSGSLLACSAPVVGSWEMNHTDCGTSQMIVADSDDGEALIRFWPEPGECVKLSYVLRWYEVGSGYEIELRCQQGDCDGRSNGGHFAMYCKLTDEAESNLACKGRTGAFDEIALPWTRTQ